MNFEDEEYVRVYSKKTNTFKKLGWEGRLVFWHLLIEADRAGVIELDEGDDQAESVAALIDVPEDIVRVGLQRLASRGVTERHGASLVITRFVEAQEAKRSDRLRAQDYRDRKRGSSPAHPPINAAGYESSSRIVTARHDSSLPASPPLSLPPPALPCLAEEAEAAPAVVRGLAQPRKLAPTNLSAALEIPIAERSRLVLEDPGNGQWSSPHTWPEVVAVAEALAKAAGHARPKLGDCRRDVGVRTVLQHFADGWAPGELAALAGAVGRSRWWRDGGVKGLSSMTAEVLRRTQNEHLEKRGQQMDPEIAREIAKTRALVAGIGSGGS